MIPHRWEEIILKRVPFCLRAPRLLWYSLVSACQIGPTFHFDVDEVDFGAISYDCPVSASTVLTNTSEISMVWRARVPQVITSLVLLTIDDNKDF